MEFNLYYLGSPTGGRARTLSGVGWVGKYSCIQLYPADFFEVIIANKSNRSSRSEYMNIPPSLNVLFWLLTGEGAICVTTSVKPVFRVLI